jgi:hypothetical protein
MRRDRYEDHAMQQSTPARYIAAAVALFVLNTSAHASQVLFLNSGIGSDSGTCGSQTGAPCKTLQQAIDNAAPGDTLYLVVAGDYGSATINKALIIQGVLGAGVFSALDVPCVTVTAPPPGTITIKEFTCSQNSSNRHGIESVSGTTLVLDQVVIKGNNTGNSGVVFEGAANEILSISDSSMADFVFGVAVNKGKALLHNVTLSGNQTGFDASASNTVDVQASLSNCLLTGNSSFGIFAIGARATVNVRDTSITFNHTGLKPVNNGSLISLGGNSLAGNTTDGQFTSTSGPQ